MAFGVKYRTEFNDLLGITWKVDIQVDPDPGVITTLKSTGSPLHIEWLSSSDEYNEPIRPSKATVNVYSETNFALAELYSDEDFKYKVLIYAGADLYWSGWVVTGEYSEPYDQPPYVVSIKCDDGLNYLKDILYDDSGTYYNGRMFESQIILDILAKIEVTTFTEYVNIYEESMLVTSDDSPMDQLKIDVDIFRDMYCFDVLYEVLKKYNAVIIQKDGVINIYRPEELTQATVYGRTFTAATTKSSTNFAPVQYIDRVTNSSNLVQNPGGALMTKAPLKKITLNQDYGNKDSWIDNWEFKGETYDRGTDTFDSWTNVGTPGTERAVSQGIKDEGFCLTEYNSYPTLSKYIKQTFGHFALTSVADAVIFEFEYMWISDTVMAAEVMYIELKTTADTYYLYVLDGVYCDWDVAQNYVTITEDVAIGISEWKTFKRQIVGLPADGTYEIRFFCLNNAVGTTKYIVKNVKFYSADATIDTELKTYGILDKNDNIVGHFTFDTGNIKIKSIKQVVTKVYEITNALNGKDKGIDYLLGDVADAGINNVIEQYAGSLASTLSTLTKVAAAFVTDHAADYVAGGVTVTSSGVTVIMTSSVAGQDFTGSTTITNTSGDLAGSVAATQANVTAQAEVDTITVTGTGGTANLSCNGVTKLMIWDTDIATTCSNFESTWAAAFNAAGVTIVALVNGIQFTANVAGTPLSPGAAIANVSGDLNGTKADTTPNRVAVARIDTITLTGTYGTADILCDAVTAEATFKMAHTTDWNTYTGTGAGRTSGAESDPLLEIIGGEIGNQYSRPKQLIQMNISETSAADTVLNIIGRVEDELNTFSGNNRTFVFNAGDFDVKPRIWTCDLIEVI